MQDVFVNELGKSKKVSFPSKILLFEENVAEEKLLAEIWEKSLHFLAFCDKKIKKI